MKRGYTPFEVHRTTRNYVTYRLRVAKKEYFHNLFISLKKNIKKTWKVINDTLKPNRSNKSSNIGKVVYNNTEFEGSNVCHAFNEHFASVGKVINDAFDGGVNNNSSLQEFLSNSIVINDTTSNEIVNIIMEMKDKPCHISAIPNKILKNICNIIAPVLSKIINKSLNQDKYFLTY